MKFDFTPDPKILIALTHTSIQPLDALCELIDNSIDSFYSAKIDGKKIDDPIIVVELPTRKNLSENSGVLRIQDNGPGMTSEIAEKAIKAGYSGNNPYDTLGLFGMGFNISTGKLGNRTTFFTSRSDMSVWVKTEINLEEINKKKDYSLDVEEIPKKELAIGNHGTIIEIRDWWPEGNQNRNCILKLIQYGMPKIREEIGRRYASILRDGKIKISINGEKCVPFEHCIWDKKRFVVRKNGNVPACFEFDQVIGSNRRCGKCRAILPSEETTCPHCGSNSTRTIEERIKGWIGIQRFDSDTEFGIDLIRNGRAIKIAEKNAFFEYVDEFKRTIKDYPIDSQYGRIVGEIHLDFVPVDFMKQDFQRTSAEWSRAMTFIRGNSSLQPTQPNADSNTSPLFKLYQAYRRVRNFGRGDMYMGYWEDGSAHRISRDKEKELYEKFKQKLPGYYDDSEWWKLVENADQPPVEELPICPQCGSQNLKEDETCSVCGYILQGKTCVFEACGKYIPKSAINCPHCGADQTPKILEPWICEICSTKNTANASKCSKCGSAKGFKNPLSEENLLNNSEKIDSLSCSNLIVRYPDGENSQPIQVDVYAVRTPMQIPTSRHTTPIIVEKSVGKMSVFLDHRHPVFSQYNVSKEHMIASEIAMYLFNAHPLNGSKNGHSLSNLIWRVLDTRWKNTLEVNVDSVYKEASEFMDDLRLKMSDLLKEHASTYFNELDNEQKKSLTNSLISSEIDLSTIGKLKDSGAYLLYVPYSFLISIFHDNPEKFFNGAIWKNSLAIGGEELLGEDNILSMREKLIRQYENCLHDVLQFLENKYSDTITLQRVKLSIEFLRKEMVT
ncbi:ATP-binding protein [uncultured Fibrobacter sp.]|uniref:ATP-binding protein n=1 Tax=uncultured Fibrobacter sp. TaxID=261512 RepID=UPI0025EF056E|nr:ATP-binding protein [uncultured Fibrobacter sp.]